MPCSPLHSPANIHSPDPSDPRGSQASRAEPSALLRWHGPSQPHPTPMLGATLWCHHLEMLCKFLLDFAFSLCTRLHKSYSQLWLQGFEGVRLFTFCQTHQRLINISGMNDFHFHSHMGDKCLHSGFYLMVSASNLPS